MDYPDKSWNFNNADSVENHVVFIFKKLENTHWSNIDDKVSDFQKCWGWEINRSHLFENPEYFKKLEDARRLCSEHEKRLVQLVLNNPKEENIEPKHKALEKELIEKNQNSLIEPCLYYFPFNIPEWPHTSYLSHDKTKRSKWKIFKGYLPEKVPRKENIFINNLFLSSHLQPWSHDAQSNIKKPNDIQLDKVSECFGMPIEFPPNYKSSSSVPMLMHIDVLWTRDDFLNAMRKQWKEIKEERKKLVSHYSSLGANFISKENRNTIIKKISSGLRQLGHYRILKHCELDWKHIKEIMPKEWVYATEKALLDAVRLSHSHIFFPKLEIPNKGEITSSMLDLLYGD